MKNFFKVFIFSALVSTSALAQVVIIGSEPPNMALMKELQEKFSKAQEVSVEDLVVGKNWNCSYNHYYRPLETEVWSFSNPVNNEVDQTGESNAKKYTFTEKGLIAEHAFEGWDYKYLDNVRKTDEGLIVERSVNPAAQEYQFVSATDEDYSTWIYYVCTPAAL